jgi:hypothetical protein
MYRITIVWLERFSNENKIVYRFCYTDYKTVTNLYAQPFTHDSQNALSYAYSNGHSAKQMCKNSDSWFVCLKQL